MPAKQAPVDPELVWSYDADLLRWATRLCRHREDAEDVAQSALVKAAEHIEGFRGEATVRTWLHQIVTNECRMLRRRGPAVPLDNLTGRPAPGGGDDADPADVAVARARETAVLAAVARLPERWRSVLLLSDGAGLPAAEVAAATGSTVSAVRAVLHRARRAVRAEVPDG